jgi:glycosyltransferase involved in cell wall biosynthesis
MSDRHYRELLASADAVVCLTTRPATMQTTVIEAVEHGKPAVISDTAVLREWRGNDRTAFFVSSHAPDELSAAIRAAAAARPDRTAERLREAIIARSAEHISRLHEAVNER